MDRELKLVLQKLTKKFVDDTGDPDSVVIGLFSERAITNKKKEEILAEKTNYKKMEVLMANLPTRSNAAINTFYKVLVECEEDDLAERLYAELKAINRAPHREEPPRKETTPRPSGGGGDNPDNPNNPEADAELPANWPDSTQWDPMKLKVVTVTDKIMEMHFEEAKKYHLQNVPVQDRNVYSMHQSKRGLFLLVNNNDFKAAREKRVELKDREGTQTDRKALTQLFEDLDFKVYAKDDFTAQEILDFIEKHASMDLSRYNCFVFAVLSHGQLGEVYGTDGETVKLERLKAAVDGKNCESLRHKPKLFIIQACQGDAKDEGCETAKGDAATRMADLNINVRPEAEKDGTGAPAEEDGKTGTRADFLIAMATVPGFVSWRVPGSPNEFSGSWFIQALAYVFSKLSHKYKVQDLLLKVNALVQKAETRGGCKQVCEYHTSMGKEFYLFPGLPRE